MSADSPHQLLDRALNRAKGDRSWDQLATALGITTTHLRRIRRGEVTVTTKVTSRIEDLFEWAPGSVDAVMAGGIPQPHTDRKINPAIVAMIAEPPVDYPGTDEQWQSMPESQRYVWHNPWTSPGVRRGQAHLDDMNPRTAPGRSAEGSKKRRVSGE